MTEKRNECLDLAGGAAYGTGAVLDGATFTLWAEHEAVRRSVAAWGCPVPPLGSPPGKHPICVDLWRVRGGRWETGDGADQHAWSERTGRATGAISGSSLGIAVGAPWGAAAGAATGALAGSWLGPAGWWWGNVTGWLAGGALGGSAGAMAGATLGSATLGSAARSWSEASSDVVGTYNEVMVSIPGFRPLGSNAGPYAFVSAMYADSPVALLGDKVFECGYRKRLARISNQGLERYDLTMSSPHRDLLSASFERDAPETAHGTDDPLPLGLYADWFSQPLFGGLDGGRFALSQFHRPLKQAQLPVPLSGHVKIGSDFFEGLAAGTYRVESLSPQHPGGGFEFSGLMARLSYPQHGKVDFGP